MCEFDVIVIGSGPAGCVAGWFLADKGYRVLMIERETFPRFHVGESLLPATQEIWEQMGFADALQHSQHTYKFAGEFRLAPDPTSARFEASTGSFHNVHRSDLTERPFAYQVNRAVFDKQLQDLAIAKGVVLWSSCSVEEVIFEGSRAVGVQLRRRDTGDKERVPAKFVIDASGRRCLIARQLDCIDYDPIIKTSGVFGHFRGVTRDPGCRQGYFNGYYIEHGWIWFIPLANDIMSVGLVQNEPAARSWSNQPQESLLAAINRYKCVQDRFRSAQLVSPVRGIKGLAYQAKKFCGDGWVAIGDANFFVDPLFSSGVHLAHLMGRDAAGLVERYLENDRDPLILQSFDRQIRRHRRQVVGIVRMIYRTLRTYRATWFYINATGPWSNHFRRWPFRSALSWSAGFYDRHRFVLQHLKYSADFFALLSQWTGRLFGSGGWQRHTKRTYNGPPLRPDEDGNMIPHPAPINGSAETSATDRTVTASKSE